MAKELKVVVFGRGTGESILIELEQDCWLAVDCFNNPVSKKPAAIDYLENKGLDPKEVLKYIVISHFHSDHITGMLDLITFSAPDAKVYISEALTIQEAVKYYSHLMESHTDAELSGVDELKRIFSYLRNNQRHAIKLVQDKVIFDNDDYIVSAISPSDFDKSESQETFINLLAQCEPGVLPQAARINPNHFCVVLSIKCKGSNKHVLLGADLEICNDPNGGWESAIDSVTAPKGKNVNVFKIPHHGSATGFHQRTWDDIVEQDAYAILTTFDRCSLPKEEYIKVFKDYTSNLFSTTSPKYKKNEVLSRQSQKILQDKAPAVNVVAVMPKNKFGYVEAFSENGIIKCSLYHDAIKL
ncbi:MBL fold metallo-hydrolase [Vibrio fluvialis]|uniref:MBL fold metallo-hydrolase n=1 Tax=Vibrio fluvialis TaxID=676 RepID=UPI001F2D7E15|nr:MBL fold metallo-hydrolase [Vibrio fluvialis]ELO1773918.1 MBL fold metallo-hydrolase [Vibrio fluvialis]ELO1776620.1 MBL fold metallo-hydrolase [Vibrio fluvialis]MCE7582914.1 MBL fold metallo-hydrolase [Vibrio fluvialis]MCG6404487.1 MBL fold metallo-hydrolase [Vibrio fluvialis]